MTNLNINIIDKVKAELARIEEDCEHSAKRHFNASSRWGAYHLWIGIPSAIIAAIAGGSAFSNFAHSNIIAGVLALLSTALTTVLTFVKPSERSEHHKSTGSQYLSLRNKSRIFREIAINFDNNNLLQKIEALSSELNELNNSAMNTTRSDYKKAKEDIDAGRSHYIIDKSAKNDNK